MPAWKHTNKWSPSYLIGYRNFVRVYTPMLYRGRHEDCADLSMRSLIDFAEANGLPVTLRNQGGVIFSSKDDGAHYDGDDTGSMFSQITADGRNEKWSDKEKFYEVIKVNINVRDLWNHNTHKNSTGPMPGDLLMIYTRIIFGLKTGRHHTGLVYKTYAPGVYHPRWNDPSVPNFPGGVNAERQTSTLEYFRGTTQWGLEGTATLHRTPDSFTHFDYLNSRGEAKRNAELIYFANAADFQSYGFQFRMYRPNEVMDWDRRMVPMTSSLVA